MNYKTTEELLQTIAAYVAVEKLHISTENKDYKGRPYTSDFVTVDKESNVCFEVFDNEIIVSYFTDHTHFEDYSSELGEGEPNYIERAKEFLVQLFTLPIKKVNYYKGSKLVSDKYYFTTDDQDEYIGGTYYRPFRALNPFRPKQSYSETYRFVSFLGSFQQVKSENADVLNIDESCYIEICEKNGAYTYLIMHREYDEYLEFYYWAPKHDSGTSFFDTKEKAINAAKENI